MQNKFTHDEMNLVCIYNPGSRNGAIDALTEMRDYLTEEEVELMGLTDSVLDKLRVMSDAEFNCLNLSLEF